jgi:hypothetical protein
LTHERGEADARPVDERSWLFSLGVALALVLVIALVRRALSRARLRARFARARRGERDARRLLESSGYAIEGEQVEGALVLQVDGQPSHHAVRADYLVRRGPRRLVAEVKTGALAPSLDHAPTRRQLLEYCAAFDVDGALLVEPEAGRIREVYVARPPSTWLRWLLAGAALGALVSALVR